MTPPVYRAIVGECHAVYTLRHASLTPGEKYGVFEECANPERHGHRFRIDTVFRSPRQ